MGLCKLLIHPWWNFNWLDFVCKQPQPQAIPSGIISIVITTVLSECGCPGIHSPSARLYLLETSYHSMLSFQHGTLWRGHTQSISKPQQLPTQLCANNLLGACMLYACCMLGPFTHMVCWSHSITWYQLMVPSLFNKTRARLKQD